MPQYHENDDLSCWFGVCFIEEYEALGKSERKEWRDENLGSAGVMKVEAEKYLEMVVSDTSSPFASAVMNSVDWEEVLDCVKRTIDEYLEEEKEEA
ncbi:hypothetical protein EBR66_06635 [bacterium]|nr:hypothetical protein [bacterium]